MKKKEKDKSVSKVVSIVNSGKENAAGKSEVIVVSTIVPGRMIAAIYGVSLRAVQQWVNERQMPRFGKDQYDLAAIRRWHEERIRSQYRQSTKDDERLVAAQADEREEKAALAKMDRKLREGELLEKVEVERGRIERILAVKTAMKALAITLSKQLAGLDDEFEIERIVATEVDDVLGRFADGEELIEAARIVSGEIVTEIGERLEEKGWEMIKEVNDEIELVLGEALS